MKVHFLFDEVQSTMLEYDRVRSFSQPTTEIYVRALKQTTGIGRSGHRWDSPRGGLWFTFAVYHEVAVDSFALFAGHCLHKLLSRLYTIPELRIKWTNDLYYQDKKLAGLLCRYHMAENSYLIGLGLNTNNIIKASRAVPNPISLKEILGFDVSNELLMKLFIREVYDNQLLLYTPKDYLDYCNEHLYGKGKLGIVEQGKERIMGKILRLSDRGNLLLDVGKLVSINHGTLKVLVDR
jgi:BirA family biotin operon repressor/biotin-[acetyl-CoA-carboxylase] ligase